VGGRRQRIKERPAIHGEGEEKKEREFNRPLSFYITVPLKREGERGKRVKGADRLKNSNLVASAD